MSMMSLLKALWKFLIKIENKSYTFDFTRENRGTVILPFSNNASADPLYLLQTPKAPA